MILLTRGCVLLVAGSWTCRLLEVECATSCQSSTPPPAPRSRRPPARSSGPSRPQPCGFSSDLLHSVTMSLRPNYIPEYRFTRYSTLILLGIHFQLLRLSFSILSLYATLLVFWVKLFFEKQSQISNIRKCKWFPNIVFFY